MPLISDVRCPVMSPGRPSPAYAETIVPPFSVDGMNAERMQKLPGAPAQLRLNFQPSFGGFPMARTSKGRPAGLRVFTRSRKNEKFCGVLKARLYVTRAFCVD